MGFQRQKLRVTRPGADQRDFPGHERASLKNLPAPFFKSFFARIAANFSDWEAGPRISPVTAASERVEKTAALMRILFCRISDNIPTGTRQPPLNSLRNLLSAQTCIFVRGSLRGLRSRMSVRSLFRVSIPSAACPTAGITSFKGIGTAKFRYFLRRLSPAFATTAAAYFFP